MVDNRCSVGTASSSVQVEAGLVTRRKLKQVKVAAEQEEMTRRKETNRGSIAVDNAQGVLTRVMESSIKRSVVVSGCCE